MNNEQILILDFGSQYTQLIARRLRELNVYCEIHPFNKIPTINSNIKGVILSGSPHSVREEQPLKPDLSAIKGQLPLLGVCYGAQYLAHFYGGEVGKSSHREYGRANLTFADNSSPLLTSISQDSQVWMSHGDTISELPQGFQKLADTEGGALAAYRKENIENEGINQIIDGNAKVRHSRVGKSARSIGGYGIVIKRRVGVAGRVGQDVKIKSRYGRSRLGV